MANKNVLKIIMITLALSLVIAVAYETIIKTGVAQTQTANTSSSIETAAYNSRARLNVYSNSACTNPITTINWGTSTTGQNTSRTIYVKNTGQITLKLSLQTSNWNPVTADGPLKITWNRQTYTLLPNQAISAVITLSVSSTATPLSSFGTKIIIVGASTSSY